MSGHHTAFCYKNLLWPKIPPPFLPLFHEFQAFFLLASFFSLKRPQNAGCCSHKNQSCVSMPDTNKGTPPSLNAAFGLSVEKRWNNFGRKSELTANVCFFFNHAIFHAIFSSKVQIRWGRSGGWGLRPATSRIELPVFRSGPPWIPDSHLSGNQDANTSHSVYRRPAVMDINKRDNGRQWYIVVAAGNRTIVIKL